MEKKQYYTNKIDILKGSGWEIWQVIKELTSKKKLLPHFQLVKQLSINNPTSSAKEYANVDR